MASSQWSSQHFGQFLFTSLVQLLRVVHQPAVFNLPTEVHYWPGKGPMVRSRYNSLDILFKVLKWSVPPHSGQEVHLGSFLQHLKLQRIMEFFTSSSHTVKIHKGPRTCAMLTQQLHSHYHHSARLNAHLEIECTPQTAAASLGVQELVTTHSPMAYQSFRKLSSYSLIKEQTAQKLNAET